LKVNGHISCVTRARLPHNLRLKNRLDVEADDVHYSRRLVNRPYKDVGQGQASMSRSARLVIIRILRVK
jgi:hypothetical protein